jgi:predicted nucleotide-binding protein (sugar kinase/HSP70/actin superfamily)
MIFSGSGLQPTSQSPNGVEIEQEIKSRLAAERLRLEQIEGLDCGPPCHYHRPAERPFTAQERDKVTILLGGLTWKHETLAVAGFEACGYHCQRLPVPDLAAFRLGKEYGNNGQCNPTYFTVGNLILFLRRLEAEGLRRQEIIDKYVFFTAGSCGPCRFGMYESEYRLALHNAGFDGFRVLLFQQEQGIKAASGEPGLKFTAHFGLSMLNALNFGDVLNDVAHQIRPYELNPGETDRTMAEVTENLARTLRYRRLFEPVDRMPTWLAARLARRPVWKTIANAVGKVYEHLYGRTTRDALEACRQRLNQIQIDRLRVKPMVKIIGEFWAQTTEGDGNFNMFSLLEREGAQVHVEPIGSWVTYLLYYAKAHLLERKRLGLDRGGTLRQRWSNELRFRKKGLLLDLGEVLYRYFYRRTARALGGITDSLVDQDELGRLARPFYHDLARGGEGHLEVAKNIYYTLHQLSHMVLSLKPFGCLPSSQSDAVQSAVISRFQGTIFLSVETAGEGEINAYSRVQMALGEAKAKAKAEFQQALQSTGKHLEDIKAYAARHPELSQPFYHVPHRPGIAGTAANFVLHVSDCIDRNARAARLCNTTGRKLLRMPFLGLAGK